MTTNDNNQLDTVAPPPSVRRTLALCRQIVAQIRNAKAAILAEFRDGLEEHRHLLRLAVNEAEALAWQTDYPHLLFPALAAEKARAVATWHLRQRSLREMNTQLAVAA
jgi:hypothetical protein